MVCLGRILVLSLVVLFGSIVVYRFVGSRITDDQIISGFMRLIDTLQIIDGCLSYIHVKGFYRAAEGVLSSLVYYKANTSGLNVERRDFDGVEVYIFDPVNGETNRPAIVYYHGGGWMLFNPKMYSALTAEFARRLNTLVVSVNYRKLPEHPFPVGVNDALTATKYFLANCEQFGVSPDRVALMGDSAGGNFVMAVGYHLSALRSLKRDSRAPKMLIPLCPSVQMLDMGTPSFLDNTDDPVLHKDQTYPVVCMYALGEMSAAALAECSRAVATHGHLSAEALAAVRHNADWQRHLRGHGYDGRPGSEYTPGKQGDAVADRFSQLLADPLFSPLSALNDSALLTLPPVCVVAATRDPLRDDARMLAKRLADAGRLAAYKEFDHYHVSFLFHSFGAERSQRVLDEVVDFFHKHVLL